MMVPPISRRAVLAGGVLASATGAADAMTSPFSLDLALDGPHAFKAVLRNRSGAAHTVLIDDRLQPAVPTLTAADGSPVPLGDQRARSKFDRTPYKTLFARLGPGAAHAAGHGRAQAQDGAFRFDWGLFSAFGLAPGGYRLRLLWKSAVRE